MLSDASRIIFKQSYQVLRHALRLGPHLPEKIKADMHTATIVAVERSIVETEIRRQFKAIIKQGKEVFSYGSNNIQLGTRQGDDAVNELLKQNGSDLSVFSVRDADKTVSIAFGKASESFRDDMQILMFARDTIVSRPEVLGYASPDGRIAVFSGTAEREFYQDCQLVAGKKDPRDALNCMPPIYIGFLRYVLSRYGVFPDAGRDGDEQIFIAADKRQTYLDHLMQCVIEHELGHVRLSRSGEPNHAAFLMPINNGENVLRAINEILVDLFVIRQYVAENSSADLHNKLLLWMKHEFPLPLSETDIPQHAAYALKHACLSALLFRFVSPESIDIVGLLEAINMIEPILLRLADDAAEAIRRFVNPSEYLFLSAQSIFMRQEFPSAIIPNLAWGVLYRRFNHEGVMDRRIASLLPDVAQIKALFPPIPLQLNAQWQQCLGVHRVRR